MTGDLLIPRNSHACRLRTTLSAASSLMVRRLIHGSSTGPYGRREKIQSRRSVLEYMLRLAFVYLAGAAQFIGSSGDLSGIW